MTLLQYIHIYLSQHLLEISLKFLKMKVMHSFNVSNIDTHMQMNYQN